MSEKASGGRSLALVVGVILVVAVAAAAIFTSMRPSPDLDPSTPEGTVQEFFQAIQEDDWDGLRAFLTPALQSDCEASELAEFQDDIDRAVIADVDTVGSDTIVEVRVSRVVVSDPLSPYSYEETFHFVLTPDNGGYLVSELPWQFYCET